MPPIVADATPIEVHYHHGWLILLFFFIGAGLHILLQVWNISQQSAKDPAAKKNIAEVFEVTWVPIAFRTFFTLCIFLLIWLYPHLVAQIPALIGHPLSADEAEVFTIPMNIPIAGGLGLFLDSLLGYIPILKSQLPQV